MLHASRRAVFALSMGERGTTVCSEVAGWVGGSEGAAFKERVRNCARRECELPDGDSRLVESISNMEGRARE